MRKETLLTLVALATLTITITTMTTNAAAAAGSLDPTFGNGGVSTITIPGNNSGIVNGAVLQSDGKIVVQGSFGVARVLPSGAIDTTFGSGGFAQAPASSNFGAVGLQADGKILVAGVGNTLTNTGF